MKYTEKYKFKKPEATDSYNIEDFNENAEAIDKALTEKAPAGFGLGVRCVNIDSANNINANGWYQTNVDTPNSNWWMCLAFVTNAGADITIQAHSVKGNYSATRSKVDGVWQPWEWDNPPMYLGTEYRTTERLGGKPVYCKYVKFGAGPNNTTKSVDHGISNIANIVEWHCFNVNSGSNVEQASNVTAITIFNTSISVTTKANEAAWLLHFLIKYTKTTD